jgi:secondary thiamine-phosphate synthase enzyme
MYQQLIEVHTRGRGTYDITRQVAERVRASGVEQGLCNLFIQHTSASLIVCENADPAVRRDLERWFARAVPDGDPLFEHDQEGPDDMPAHVRSVLTQTSLTVPIAAGRLALGVWQGVYLWEHRLDGGTRRVLVTIVGGQAVE